MRKVIEWFYWLLLQPFALLAWSCVIIATHLIFHFLGWRELTSVLSGTFPSYISPPEAATRATIYLVSYFATILVAPVMFLGAIIDLATRRLLKQSA